MASELKTFTKKLQTALKAKQADQAKAAYQVLVKRLDQIASKGLIHKNTASRRKARFARHVAQLSAA